MTNTYKESDYERAIMELFGGLGYQTLYAPDIKRDFQSPLYDKVLEEQILKLNPNLPREAIENALYKLRNFDNGELVQKNEIFMDYLQNGIEVRYFVEGEERSALVYVVDYGSLENNSFIAANQWTFTENSTRRLDIVLFLNGLPVVVVELKSPSREEADISEAYRQIRNYMQEIPTLFIYNAFCVISDLASTRGCW